MVKHNSKWECISNCGACCRLAPQERLEAIKALSEPQTKLYFSLVDEDGWCRYYNKSQKICSIYTKRPDFCRVTKLSDIFNINSDDTDITANQFCRDHIKSIYGGRSKILKRFEKNLRKIN